MIRIKDSVPSIYYNSSRDFQLLGHLFDLVLNAVKTDADMVFNLPFSINSDDQLLDLLTYTFGLRLNRSKYTSRQLRAVCSVVPIMMRNKGSYKAIEALCTALMNAEQIAGEFLIYRSDDGTAIWIKIAETATCYSLLQEILPYIMPAGVDFSIQYLDTVTSPTPKENVGLRDTVTYNLVRPGCTLVSHFIKDKDIVPNFGVSAAGLFNTDTGKPTLIQGDLATTALYTGQPVPAVTENKNTGKSE
jgi:hypothetical protein